MVQNVLSINTQLFLGIIDTLVPVEQKPKRAVMGQTGKERTKAICLMFFSQRCLDVCGPRKSKDNSITVTVAVFLSCWDISKEMQASCLKTFDMDFHHALFANIPLEEHNGTRDKGSTTITSNKPTRST